MNKQISILHGDYSPEVRDMVANRLDSMNLFGSRLDSLTARLGQTHETHEVEIVAGVGKEGTLVAKSQTENIVQAVDEAIERLTSQLRKLHARRVQRHKGH